MRHYTLTKAIGWGRRRRGCSRLVIVHHRLHGSDACRSIFPFEQTTGGGVGNAGGAAFIQRPEGREVQLDNMRAFS